MQGDIFQLESLTSQVSVPKPQSKPALMARSMPTTVDPQVAIYNEDDLSHLLYVSNNPHHTHHHHHHRHQFTHPADAGTIMVNTIPDDMEDTTPALSDCDSCYGSEYSGHSVESPLTPPLSTLDDVDDQALEAYRRKGRRNAFSTDFQDGYGFPVFLGRQDEGEVEELAPITRKAPQELPSQTLSPATKRAEEIPASHHVSAVEGPMMSWWPEPLENMEADWTVEKTQWQLKLEKEKLKEIERENGVIKKEKKSYTGQYGAAPVDNIDGPLMNWWPAPLYDWSERFYE